MTLTKVLEMLYGKVASGYLQATYIENGKCRSKCFQIDQLSEMESFIRKYGKSCNTYIDINPRNREMEYYERGSRDDISTVVGAYQDYDIKGIAHKEENLPLSAEELYAFLKELPIQPTFLVYTGNGVHAYWLFEKPYEIRSASERNYIEQILKGWETHVHQLAKERYGWNFDAVADLPRMLRAPETTNFKTEERPVCKVVSICENYYLPVDLEPYCDVKPSSANPVPDADEFALMGTGSGEKLVSKCTFLQHCRDNAANISEPYWYAMLSNVALTADGHEMAHSLSSPYPGYSYQETEKKYRHALEQDKPTTCEFIKNRLCFHCGRSCGVRAPIALVHSKASVPPNWEEPIPFDNFSVPDFPVETLPEAIGTYVSAVAESTQTPVDLAATSAIAIMSICLQGKYKIQPKGDWQENLNTFCLAFMEPSERKSAVGSAMLRPINTYEQEWNKLHAAEVDFSKTEKSILERRLKTLEDQASKGKAEISEVRKASEELTNFREKRPLQLYVDDVTTEKLVSILAENDGKTAIFSTEGGIFDMLKGIYTKYVNIDVFLKSYSGDPIRVDRIGRASESILNPTLTVMLMAQPSVLAGIMQNDTFRGRGLTARFLYCMPQSNVGNRRYRSEEIPAEVYQNYERCIRNLLSAEPDNKPEIITLSPEADAMLEAFAEELEPKLLTEHYEIREWAGKLVGTIARISGLLCRTESCRTYDFLDDPEPLVVSGADMQNAILIGRYYLEHAKAAFSLMGADDGAKKCQYVLDAIVKAGLSEFTRRDVMRLCRALKTAAEMQPVLDQLVDYGYLVPKDSASPSGKGRPPAQSYLVNPRIYDNL